VKRSCPSCASPTINPLGLFGFRKVTCANCGARVAPHWLITNVVLHSAVVLFVTALVVSVTFIDWGAGALVLLAWALFEFAHKCLVPLEVVTPGTQNDEEKGQG
jgi:O-antigen ligase